MLLSSEIAPAATRAATRNVIAGLRIRLRPLPAVTHGERRQRAVQPVACSTGLLIHHVRMVRPRPSASSAQSASGANGRPRVRPFGLRFARCTPPGTIASVAVTAGLLARGSGRSLWPSRFPSGPRRQALAAHSCGGSRGWGSPSCRSLPRSLLIPWALSPVGEPSIADYKGSPIRVKPATHDRRRNITMTEAIDCFATDQQPGRSPQIPCRHLPFRRTEFEPFRCPAWLHRGSCLPVNLVGYVML